MEFLPLPMVLCAARNKATGRYGMAQKNEKPEISVRRPTPQVQVSRTASTAAQQDAEMRRLLREAAWSRMFGKAAAPKNPFGR
jgi:hypothetical protein